MGRLRRNNARFQQKGIQLALSKGERIEMLQNGLTQACHQLGLMVVQEMLEEDVIDLCGPMHKRLPAKAARRWGSQAGVVTLAGRKVAIQRPRARMLAGGEAELESYRHLQSPEAMPENALRLLLRGVSTRNYEGCLEKMAEEGFGTKRSSVSRHWVKATAKQMQEFAERRFDNEKFVAVFMDGVSYGGEMLLVALGVTEKGHKIVLGIRQGATENAVVCKDLLTDLRGRGLDTEGAVLWVLDGSLALAAAVKAIWGNRCLIQRCQQHKIRNVLGYLADKYHEDIRGRMSAAYSSKDWHDAEERLLTLISWLKRINAAAAASLREGMEETLTVQKLGLPAILAKSLVTTNPIESVFSAAAPLTGRVKRWRQGNMRMRWAVTGALRAEKNFNRLKGYREIPMLQEALERKIGRGALDETAKAA